MIRTQSVCEDNPRAHLSQSGSLCQQKQQHLTDAKYTILSYFVRTPLSMETFSVLMNLACQVHRQSQLTQTLSGFDF